MKLQLAIHNFELPLQHPFTISRYTVTIQKTVVVAISDGEFTGYGEATVNPYYHSSVESLKAALESVRAIIENLSEKIHPTQFWKLLEPKLHDNYFALCALDCAYWDLYAKQHQKPLRRFWSEHDTNLPKTNFTIGIDTISVMQSKIQQKPWAIYKVKLGTKNDVEIIEKLREVTDAVFRVDANCAWTEEETLKNAIILKELGVEFIEQPLKADNWEA